MTMIHLQVLPGMTPACGTFQPTGGLTLQQFNHQMTGEPRAVTCPTCKSTEAYKLALTKIKR